MNVIRIFSYCQRASCQGGILWYQQAMTSPAHENTAALAQSLADWGIPALLAPAIAWRVPAACVAAFLWGRLEKQKRRRLTRVEWIVGILVVGVWGLWLYRAWF